MSKFNIGLYAASMLLFFCSIASAQEPQSAKCGYMCHVPMAMQGGGGQMASRGLRPLEGNFTQMKARFGIRLEQEAAWNKFAEEVNRPHPDPHQVIGGNMPTTSVERAKFMEEVWRLRYEQMQAITAAFKELYTVLDEDQKAVADQRFGYCEIAR